MLAALNAKLKGWRTIIVNVVTGIPVAALLLVQQVQGVDVTPLFPPAWGPRIIAGLALANVLLRLITDGPVGKKA